eukprot:564777-Amphidinium_carterae.1
MSDFQTTLAAQLGLGMGRSAVMGHRALTALLCGGVQQGCSSQRAAEGNLNPGPKHYDPTVIRQLQQPTAF